MSGFIGGGGGGSQTLAQTLALGNDANALSITNLANGSSASDAAAFGQIPTSFVVICDSLPSGTQASFDTNTILGGNIPQTHNDLRLRVSGRGDTSAVVVNLNLTINNDSTAAHYRYFIYYNRVTSPGSTSSDGDSKIILPEMEAGTETAGYASTYEIVIPLYTQTVFDKHMTVFGYSPRTGAGAGGESFAGGAQWLSTSAVTRIAVTPASGSFIAGSRFTLYGIG